MTMAIDKKRLATEKIFQSLLIIGQSPIYAYTLFEGYLLEDYSKTNKISKFIKQGGKKLTNKFLEHF